MKRDRNERVSGARETYRPRDCERTANRPTFDRFPNEILFPMNIYRLK